MPYKLTTDGKVLLVDGKPTTNEECCCTCLSLWGESFTLTLSGVVSCGCIAVTGGFIGLIGTLPSVWVFTPGGFTDVWTAPSAGTATWRAGESPCSEGGFAGHFEASGTCLPGSDRVMVITVTWVAEGSVIDPIVVFAATFTALGDSRSNEVVCSNVIPFPTLFGDGNGSLLAA